MQIIVSGVPGKSPESQCVGWGGDRVLGWEVQLWACCVPSPLLYHL